MVSCLLRRFLRVPGKMGLSGRSESLVPNVVVHVFFARETVVCALAPVSERAKACKKQREALEGPASFTPATAPEMWKPDR